MKTRENHLRRFTLFACLIGLLSTLSGLSIGRAEDGQPSKRDRTFTHLTPQEAYALIQNNRDNPNFVIVDLRTTMEYDSKHIEDAIHLNYYSRAYRDELDKLDKNQVYLVYCRDGRRTEKALRDMKERGFEDVYDMPAGLAQWRREGLPTVKSP